MVQQHSWPLVLGLAERMRKGTWSANFWWYQQRVPVPEGVDDNEAWVGLLGLKLEPENRCVVRDCTIVVRRATPSRSC